MALNNTINQAAKAAFRAFKGAQIPVTLIGRSPGDYNPMTGEASVIGADADGNPNIVNVGVDIQGINLGYFRTHQQPLQATVVFDRRDMDKALEDLRIRISHEWDFEPTSTPDRVEEPAEGDHPWLFQGAERDVALAEDDWALFRPDSIDEGKTDTKRILWRVHGTQYSFGVVKVEFHSVLYEGQVPNV